MISFLLEHQLGRIVFIETTALTNEMEQDPMVLPPTQVFRLLFVCRKTLVKK